MNLTYTKNAASGNAFTQVTPWYRYDRVAYDGDLANDLAGGKGGLRQDRRSEFEGLRLSHFHVFGKHAVKLGLDGSIENFVGREHIVYATDGAGNQLAERVVYETVIVNRNFLTRARRLKIRR